MLQGSSVLMVSGGGEIDLALRKVLDEAGIDVRLIGNCAATRNILKNFKVPTVRFSEATLPDGTWEDVLGLATGAQLQVVVIVVSRLADMDLYITALEKGASDFIAPPFYRQDVSHVLKRATQSRIGVREFCLPRVAAA